MFSIQYILGGIMCNQKTKMIRSCRSKKKYKSIKAAQCRASNLWGQGIKLKVYGCQICGGFHLARIDKAASLDMAFREIEKQRAKA